MIHLSDNALAARVARDIPDGSYVNLGIGKPTHVSAHMPEGREVIYHSENGILGVGPTPPDGQEDPEMIDASKRFITAAPGASFFEHSDSFMMMRGGHLDIAVLGAYQVAENGDLANWATLDQKFPPAVGGAMDLVVGVPTIFVMMRHTNRDGSPKLMRKCTYPLTGLGVVNRVYTDLAVLDVTKDGFRLVELTEGNTVADVQSATEATIHT
ncbi:3-oxoadipate CoA-transferase subunit B (plasmid) [Pseudosulfitobacter pseudonitzschiae]|jgi:3-oxoacid CoA-transferase B subunit|uniref:3-oxoadipate CoA-transferase subunit B n=1 Tax=Pseudosulfitobacter pseudonitzschiae TaxID=1402135 RepID=A0A221K8L0_9RHOB|nr:MULTISPECIES: 3-oxoacid CoA-transferase subunit B [Roseobacteraceae]ASM75305.1 3-oxoadipate CoA-transferase subunit B [Pseudosulfitobacter pseudonitzschiae]|tara:strand:- start:11962 stop:12597 length:636 start_codon:yes stop_codon:yes gene_type:complete